MCFSCMYSTPQILISVLGIQKTAPVLVWLWLSEGGGGDPSFRGNLAGTEGKYSTIRVVPVSIAEESHEMRGPLT